MNAHVWLGACVAGLALASPARADSEVPRHWIARIGIHPVHPRSEPNADFKADPHAGFSLGATYLFSKHWALELFAVFPRSHELHIDEEPVGSFEMIPTTATVQYHVSDAGGRMRAYVGLGIGHASIGSEQTKASLAGLDLRIDDATGVAATAGIDMDIGPLWFVNLDARWIDLDSTMRLAGSGSQRFIIDPYMFGLSIGRRLR